MSNKELEFIKSKGLTKEFEEFKMIPKWEIRWNSKESYLCLYRNNKYMTTLTTYHYFMRKDFCELIYEIGYQMECFTTEEQLLNKNDRKYQVYFDNIDTKWYTAGTNSYVDSSYIVNTKENAQKIADLLNSSKDLKEWMGGKDE